jgi:predicted transglutaminase-like cysteine proteinase
MIVQPVSSQLDKVDIIPLLPNTPPPKDIWDIEPTRKGLFVIPPGLYSVLTTQADLQWEIIQFSRDKDSGLGYEKHLQFPNNAISSQAKQIVLPTDSVDHKVYKIEQWVQQNIEYVSDIENYGIGELWAFPTVTLNRGTGDCEDGAFLIHSLALGAGVPHERLRTYGGIVVAGNGAETGGHAWTAFKRSIDDEWVILDFSYYPTSLPINERMPMSGDLKYIDDFFFVQVDKTVETPFTNRVRYATGSLLNILA